MSALTPTGIDSTDVTPVGASAIPKSPTCYPGLIYPGQSTPLPPNVLTSDVLDMVTLSSDSSSHGTLSSTSITKGTLTPA